MASPFVRTVEYDLSQRVPAYQGMYGLVIGNFDRGPVNERIFLSQKSDSDLRLGKPGPNSDQAYYVLHSYLTKAQRCWAVRVANGALYGGLVLGAYYNTTLGTGDGVTTVFTGTLPYSRCIPGTVEIWQDSEKVGYDIATTGALNGTGLAHGTVTYSSGAITVTFDDSGTIDYTPPVGAIIYARWGFPNVDFTTLAVGNDVLLDPTEYAWDGRTIELELVDQDTNGLISDRLVPYAIDAPDDAVTTYTDTDCTLVIYDGTTPIIYGDENSELQDVAGGTTYLDATQTNVINYSTGVISFYLDATYTPTAALTAKYTSLYSDAGVVYSDNPGIWTDKVGVIVRDFDIPNNTFYLQCWEQTIVNGTILTNSLSSDNWKVSRDDQVDGFNAQMQWEERINGNSYYVRVYDNANLEADECIPASSIAHSDLAIEADHIEYFDGGSDGTAVSVSNYMAALDLFENKEAVDLDIIMDTLGSNLYHVAIANLCDRERGGRGDCYGILYTPHALEVSTNYIVDLINFRKYTQNLNCTWVGLYTGHVKIWDTYNSRELYIPPSGFVGAAFSFTADQFDPWWVAAGWRRGLLPILDVYRRYTQGERDALYDNELNAMRFKPGKGIAIWGQKTLTPVASALDRANVRWLLIVIENAIEEFLDDYVFEFNDEYTRSLIRAAVNSYLETIKNRRGLYAYDVVCDDTNNSNDDIDNYRMNVDTYVQPMKAAEYIYNRVIITRTGVDFSTVRIA